MELSEEDIAEWVAKHLATAPERDEAWSERVMAIYARGLQLAGDDAAA